MILVDPLREYPEHRSPVKWFCHMVSDHGLDELHAMAARLELPPPAFHRDHYDLTPARRTAALALGAVEVGRKDLVRRMQPRRRIAVGQR